MIRAMLATKRPDLQIVGDELHPLGRVSDVQRRQMTTVLAPNVYAMNLASPGKVERLGEPGFVHGAAMDKSGQTLLVTSLGVALAVKR